MDEILCFFNLKLGDLTVNTEKHNSEDYHYQFCGLQNISHLMGKGYDGDVIIDRQDGIPI
jgi:hypothetical protein